MRSGSSRREDLANPVMLPAVHVLEGGSAPSRRSSATRCRRSSSTAPTRSIPSQHEFFPANIDDLQRRHHVLHRAGLRPRCPVRLRRLAARSSCAIPTAPRPAIRCQAGRSRSRASPRGDYQMRVEGAAITNWRPISVSRDQTVELSPVSRLDLGTVATVIVILSRWTARRRQSPSSAGGAVGLGPPGRDPTSGGGPPAAPEPGPQLESPSARAGAGRVSLCAGVRRHAPLSGVADRRRRLGPRCGTPGDARRGSPSPARPPAPTSPRSPYFYIWFDPTSWNRAKADLPLAGQLLERRPLRHGGAGPHGQGGRARRVHRELEEHAEARPAARAARRCRRGAELQARRHLRGPGLQSEPDAHRHHRVRSRPLHLALRLRDRRSSSSPNRW